MPNTFSRSQIVRLSKEYSDPNFTFPVGTRGRVIHKNEQSGLWKIAIEDEKFPKADGTHIYVGPRSLATAKRGRQAVMLAEPETETPSITTRMDKARRKLVRAVAATPAKGVRISPINWKLMLEDTEHKHPVVVGEGRMTRKMLAAFGIAPANAKRASASSGEVAKEF